MPRGKRKNPEAEISGDGEVKTAVTKHPLPDGYRTPSDFAVHATYDHPEKGPRYSGSDASIYSLSKFAFPTQIVDAEGNPKLNDDGSPAMKEPNGFPAIMHTDGRVIIHLEDGLAFLDTYSSNQKAKRAVAAERAANAASARIVSVARYTLLCARAAKSDRERITVGA